jgi:thiopurine S-methyltransferase
MQSDFWQQRWRNNQIGFHEGTVNRFLAEHWSALSPRGDETVFVPLCGKALDMAWLRERGHRVFGVEMSSIACRTFFTERGIEPTVTETGAFVHYAHDGIDLLCGDVFDLQRGQLRNTVLFYDRAALIALPPEARERYCAHLSEIMTPDGRGLLITLDYPDQAFDGPPFAVSDSEVRRQLGIRFDIDCLHSGPLRPDDPLIERGLRSAVESVWRLTAKL